MLAKQGRLVLAAPVYQEIGQWLSDPKCNQVAAEQITRAILGNDSSVALIDFSCSNNIIINLFEYYINLLGIRKKGFDLVITELTQANGKPPTNQEISNYCKDRLGPRAQMLAGSGANAKVKSHKFNDEALVIMSIVEAICSGKETAVLTRDEDVYEQFYKALWLIDTHYRSMLLADQFATNPEAYPIAGRHVDTERKAFEGEVILIRKPSARLMEIVPREYNPVLVHCFFIGDKIAHSSFMAEQQMKRMLGVKARTGGLSTDRLDSRNCHIFLNGLNREWSGLAAIGEDIAMGPGSASWSIGMIDANLALFDCERGTRVAEDQPQLIVVPPQSPLWFGTSKN